MNITKTLIENGFKPLISKAVGKKFKPTKKGTWMGVGENNPHEIFSKGCKTVHVFLKNGKESKKRIKLQIGDQDVYSSKGKKPSKDIFESFLQAADITENADESLQQVIPGS